MDPLIISFQPRGVSLGEVASRVEQQLSQSPGYAFRSWEGATEVYVAVSGAAIGDLQGLAAVADARLTGAARLVFDESEFRAPGVPIEEILRPDFGRDIVLESALAPAVDAEKLVCPLCGGIDRHFSPPH